MDISERLTELLKATGTTEEEYMDGFTHVENFEITHFKLMSKRHYEIQAMLSADVKTTLSKISLVYSIESKEHKNKARTDMQQTIKEAVPELNDEEIKDFVRIKL